MDARLTLLVPNSQDGIRGAADDLERFFTANGLPATAVWPFYVALDELLSNTIRCGYAEPPGQRRIEVQVHLHDGVLEMSITDDAAPFNPLEAPEPDTTQALQERSIGGLGIHIVKGLMNHIEYERKEGRNVLVLRKRLDV